MASETKYLIHVKDECPWCTRAKSLLEYYNADYSISTEPCAEWPTWPAIYRIKDGDVELIGGYDQLCAISCADDL